MVLRALHRVLLELPFVLMMLPCMCDDVKRFMCHHSLPSLLTPINDKSEGAIRWLLSTVLGCTLVFYLLLCFTASFRFTVEELERSAGLYTLNFAEYHFKFIARGLEFFPVFVLSANFPIIAITLKNNLKTLTGHIIAEHFSERSQEWLYPILAVGPPICVAYYTQNVGALVGYTGAYAGCGIQYVIPALLVHTAREKERNGSVPGAKGDSTIHRSWCRDPMWVYGVCIWSVFCWVVVTFNLVT